MYDVPVLSPRSPEEAAEAFGDGSDVTVLAGGTILLPDVTYDDADRQTGYAAFWRPHTHHYTILAVAAARANGELRVAATGAGPTGVRLTSVEQSGNPEDAVKDVDPKDDPLASAWYRKR